MEGFSRHTPFLHVPTRLCSAFDSSRLPSSTPTVTLPSPLLSRPTTRLTRGDGGGRVGRSERTAIPGPMCPGARRRGRLVSRLEVVVEGPLEPVTQPVFPRVSLGRCPWSAPPVTPAPPGPVVALESILHPRVDRRRVRRNQKEWTKDRIGRGGLGGASHPAPDSVSLEGSQATWIQGRAETGTTRIVEF